MKRCASIVARTLFAFTSLLAAAMAQSNPVPFVNQPLVPTSAAPGHRAFTLTVNGTGFAAGATVNWNGAARATTFISSSQLKAAIAAADVARRTTATVTVVNPKPAGGSSNAAYFSVNRPTTAMTFYRHDLEFSSYVFAGLAVADFNNDGKLDIAMLNFSNGSTTVEVYFGNGNGTFRAPVLTTFNFGVGSPVAGDFNGDGNADLAVAVPCLLTLESCLSILLGTGDGHFTLAGDATVLGWPLATGDFNADGNLDVITTNASYEFTDYYPDISLGQGTGTFGSTFLLADTYGFGSPAVGDFNHDGKLDVVVPGEDYSFGSRELYVFFGNGDGTFQSPAVYVTGNRIFASWAAVGDLNGDGNLDIVTGDVFVFLGNKDGTFTNAGGVTLTSFNSDVQLADFNNDNKLDALVLAGANPVTAQETVNVLLGNGDGTFQPPQLLALPNNYFQALGVGDFNGDGALDVIAAGPSATVGSASVSLFLQTTLAMSPTELNFGYLKLGTSSTLSSVLTNVGQVNANVGAVQLIDPWGNYTQSNDCSESLAPGASCTITVTFAPKALISFTRAVNIAHGGSPQVIVLTGSGY